MIPWVELDRATVPDGGGALRLMQRGDEFSIMAGATSLMTSRRTGSEEALATIGCARIKNRTRPRVLIGGLGVGFTLRAALDALPQDAAIVVSELVPAVVAWAKGPLAGIFGASLSDPRVSIEEKDVATVIAAASAEYDAILLDVDNGPEGLTRKDNDKLYDQQGLRTTRAALRPRGILAVWSSGPDPRFTKRLATSGFDVEEVKTRANGPRGGPWHMIWIAAKPAR